MILLGGVVPIVSGYLLSEFLPDWRWVSHEFHHLAESIGAFSAAIIGSLILAMRQVGKGLPSYVWLAYAFFGMGVLDAFHSVLDAGQAFVWLHSTATIVGGALAALIWLPKGLVPRVGTGAVFYLVLSATTALGLVAFLFPETVPTMVAGGHFTAAARALNVLGGLGFITAAAFFLVSREGMGAAESTIFATQAFLFGIAGILFDFSELWDGAWWLWHVLRITAYLAVVIYFFTLFLQGQKELQAKEERNRLLLSSTAEAIYGVDLEGRCMFSNPACVRILGYGSEQDLAGRNMHDLIHHTRPDGTPYPNQECRIYQAFREGTGAHVEDEVFWRADGSAFPVEYWSYPIHRNDDIVGAVITFIDITERKAAEDALQQKTRELGERVKELECLYTMSQAMARDGAGIDEVFQEMVDAIPASWQHSDIARARLSVGGKEYRSANFEEGPWKQTSDIRVTGAVVGTLEVHYLEESPERSEGPFLEEERSLLDEMALRIGQFLEARRADEELRRYTAQLEAANKELETFAYSVSHDLRAPLRAIDGFSQALVEDYGDKLEGEAKLYLDRLRSGSQTMAELIDGLLKLSRSTRGELRQEDVNLSDMASEIAEQLRKEDAERNAAFRITPEVIVTADPRLLRAALENLLGNAWKFTRDNPETVIEFGARNVDGRVTCYLRDNGVGFDMAYADKLFAPFQRLHRQDEFEGTGIGLSTVERIVHRHGGRIWAEGVVGKGATFFIELQTGRT